MPETVTILEATAEANHHMAVQKATNVWKNESEQMIPESGYLSAKAFDEKAAQLLEKSLSTFDGTKRMLSAKYGKQYRDDLEQDILGKMDVMRKLNDEKRAAKLLQTPLILFFTIMVAWFAVFILGELSPSANRDQTLEGATNQDPAFLEKRNSDWMLSKYAAF